MKLDDGDWLVRVRTCSEDEDVLLSTRLGKCIRFPVTDVRVFAGRSSTGVRGIRLDGGDQVISMSCLRHVRAEVAEREEYLQADHARRRLAGSEYEDRAEDRARDAELAAKLELPAFAKMAEDEEFILTISEDGMGKRSSAYEYRISGRGGKGIDAMDLRRGAGAANAVVASFPVLTGDELVMVSDGGQIIRMPVEGISILGRRTRGVTLFKVGGGEDVVSVTRLRDVDDGVTGDNDGAGDNGGAGEAAPEGESGPDDVVGAAGDPAPEPAPEPDAGSGSAESGE
jgi:DNA gyrase subunit A